MDGIARVISHKTASVLNKFPKSMQPAMKADLREIWQAETRAAAEAAIDTFTKKFRARYEKASTCLTPSVLMVRCRTAATTLSIGLPGFRREDEHLRFTLTVGTAILGMTAALSAAAQQSVSEAWGLEGFSTPESAVFDSARNVIYISNVAGQPLEKNGACFISRVSPGAELLGREWVTGLDAPKGLVIDDTTLYVSDIDRHVVIDIEAGENAGAWSGEGAHFLNDTSVDPPGRVCVSDTTRHRIYRLEGEAFALWLEDEALEHPNGLKVDTGACLSPPGDLTCSRISPTECRAEFSSSTSRRRRSSLSERETGSATWTAWSPAATGTG